MKNPLRNLLNEDEQKIIIFLLFFAFLGLCLKFFNLTATNNRQSADSLNFEKDYEIKYELNVVSKEELMSIPGIGDKKSSDIIAYREEFGFYNKRDIMKVKGIGEKTFSKIEKYFIDFNNEFVLEEKNPDNTTSNEDKGFDASPETGLELSLEFIVNINTANADELSSLKGIGKVKALRIIELRDQLDKFENIEQLLEVKGIGQKTLEKIRNNITVGD